ncbi:MAG: energy-coupling factor transporter transmembrane component T [Eubacteriales bacterium]
MKGFLDYCAGNSVLHRLNPLVKLFFALATAVSAFISSSLLFVALLIVIDLALGYIGGIAKRTLGIFKGLAKISMLLIIMQLLIIHDGNVLLPLPLGMSITDHALRTALLIVERLIASTIPLTVMLSVTQMNDLSNVLVRCLHIPCKYAFAFTTAIRFIPLFAQEMESIIEAQTSRGVEFDTKNIVKKLGLVLPLCIPLLVTSVRKIDISAVSVEMRGFNMRNPANFYNTYRISPPDIIAAALAALMVAAAVIF